MLMSKRHQQCDSCKIRIRHGFPQPDRRLFCTPAYHGDCKVIADRKEKRSR